MPDGFANMLKKLFGKKPPRSVELLPGGVRYEVERNQTVLESALQQGIAYPHDCTVGTCGTCRSRLVSGQVEAITPFGYTLSREELEQGYILACQALAKSDLTIEVELEAAGLPQPRVVAARLAEAVDLTHDIKRVTWETGEPVHYRAGQYMNVAWPGSPGHRSYSFSAAPGEAGLTRLTSFIRKVPGGAFTELLFSGAANDLDFTLDAPHGQFWLREAEGPILMVGGGSGLSPLMSVLEDAEARGVARDVILLFGARGVRDLYCKDEIAALEARWPARFEYWPVLSEETAEGYRHGFVTAHVGAALAQLGSGVTAYMCGPPAMIDTGVAALSSLGIGLDAIHYDKFTDESTRAH